MSKLPARWTDRDHAIYDARIRQRMPWREVGEKVGMSWSAARERFYRRMAKVTPAEIEAMRAEENAKMDEQERMLMGTFLQAHRDSDWSSCVAAAKGLDQVGRSRRQLNGLDVPVVQRIEVSDDAARTDFDGWLATYLTGVADGAADGAPVRGD